MLYTTRGKEYDHCQDRRICGRGAAPLLVVSLYCSLSLSLSLSLSGVDGSRGRGT